MTNIKNKIKDIEKYMKNKNYDSVIEKSIDIYTKYSPNIKYLNYVLEVYKLTNITNKSSQLKRLLEYTPVKTPQFCIIHNELGNFYFNSEQYNLAIEHYKQVITIKNDIPELYYNLSVSYAQLKEFNRAKVCLNISLKLKPSDNTYSMLGAINLYMKNYEESIKAYKSIKELSSVRLYNTCFPYLASKQFLKGFELYEHRLYITDCQQTKKSARVEVPLPYWNGIDICRHIIIIYEQGIGDNIQYFRFIIELSEKNPNMKITYFCRSSVSHLFNDAIFDNINVIDDSKPIDLSIYDKKLYIMSIPYILKLDLITSNKINYIFEDNHNNELWKQKLLQYDNKLKVGFLYSGRLQSYIEKNIELCHFRDICCDERFATILLDIMDQKMYNDILQTDFLEKIIKFDIDRPKSFFDTISILRNIDILVTIDTSIAHLAGVMGIKTLLLIGYLSEWRWFNNEEPVWYETVKIIRVTEAKPLSSLIPLIKNILIQEYNSKQILPHTLHNVAY